jgi:CxxC motif-containing protein
MTALTCIVCPIGCALTITEGPPEGSGAAGPEGPLIVAGNRCPRGAVYAREEIRAPKRVVTATCALALGTELAGRPGSGTELDRRFPVSRRVPVKSSVPCPKEKIPELLGDIYKIRLRAPVKPGDLVISDWRGSGIDVIAVRTLG